MLQVKRDPNQALNTVAFPGPGALGNGMKQFVKPSFSRPWSIMKASFLSSLRWNKCLALSSGIAEETIEFEACKTYFMIHCVCKRTEFKQHFIIAFS